MKPWMYQALKMVVGTFFAIEIAALLNLDYSVTAGVIVLLSIQSTKIRSIQLALKRSIATFLGLGLSVVLFLLFGYELYIFILALLLFIPLAYMAKVEDGIVVTTVLISHVLLGKDLSYALNAIYLLAIGVIVALLVNIYMPSYKRKIIKEIDDIDQSLRDEIKKMIDLDDSGFSQLEALIDKALSRIQFESDNHLFSPKDLNIEYVSMRKEQLRYLKEIHTDLKKVQLSAYKKIVIDFLCDIRSGIGKDNMAKPLLINLEHIRQDFKTKALPATRSEFEERAILYHILFDIEGFLMAKIHYHELIDAK